MRANDSAQSIDILCSCSKAVRDWYLSNNLLLNADKSKVIILGTANQLRLATVDSVEVAGTTLPVAPTLKSLGVILDQRLTFDDHATAVVKTCNFYIRAVRHVRHLLPESTALTLVCSLINSRVCNALLYRAPASTISKLQRVQNSTARAVLAAIRCCDAKPLLGQLHWLPVRQRILYKTAVTTRKMLTTGVPAYLKEHLVRHAATRQTRSAARPLLTVPRTNTEFSRRSFSYATPVT